MKRSKGMPRGYESAGTLRRALACGAVALLVAACGNSTATGTPVPSARMTPTPWASIATPAPSPTASPTPAPPAPFPAAVIARFDDNRPNITSEALQAALAGGKVTVPCEFTSLSLGAAALTIATSTPCLPVEQITATIHDKGGLALLPPGLVTPSIKVLPIGEADLFGAPKHRAMAYPLFATVSAPAAWTEYSEGDVRTLISTGDTCPDRGVSYMANTKGKGWDWVLNGGSVRYRYMVTSDWGWPVPAVAYNHDNGAVADLISDNDVSANDFECPIVKNAVQHNTGTIFNIDPRAATLLATKGGLKVVTLGSNHITDAHQSGIIQTLNYLDAAGIKHTGAGRTLADALAPAVVEVRGITFAFVGWDDIHGSQSATSTRPGVAPMTNDNVCNSIKAARAVADIVIAMPQWGWPEYHATITKEQIAQRTLFYDCGADGILGSGTHWASWASILPGPNGPRFAIGSHGNFLFDQSWSRQTMEGVIVEVTFYGKTLVQFRLHPYVITHGAQPNLIDPTTDGRFVLKQVWSVSDIR
jgi:poly-gamma-glutamate capsule biosynthesis protein CapA/YwtB (metallophosphatase superfamily)